MYWFIIIIFIIIITMLFPSQYYRSLEQEQGDD